MNVIYPPETLISQKRNEITVFLAGSIEMGTATKWQDQVIDHLNSLPITRHYTLFNPRRQDWDSTWEQDARNPNFYQQVNWELNALDKADKILMYFDPGTKSPISLLELGLYASSGKLIVVCPDGFWKKGNVELVCEKYGIPMFDNLTDGINNV